MIADHDLDVASSLGIKPFRANWPWWGGDLQTLRNRIVRPVTSIPGQSKRFFLDLNDGTSDKLWAMLDAPDISTDAPLVVLVHGLTGSEDSDYMRCSAAFFLEQNYRVLRLNLRGAGPSINQCIGHYHSGCADDIQMALNALPKDLLDKGVFMIGFSLGGNILTHLLANREPSFEIKGAVTISASIDPAGAARRLMAPRNALYQKWLLKQMAHECLSTRSYIAPDLRKRLLSVRSVYEFDDVFTAPRNGYRDADDYYAKTSGWRIVPEINVPTLLIHAENDPWIPAKPYKQLAQKKLQKSHIQLTKNGGHVGFHSCDYRDRWHDVVAGAFFDMV